MIVLTIASLLVVALLGGALFLYQTEAMWDMTSPNAMAFNATLNSTATFGINVIPIIVLAIMAFVILAVVSGCRGFG
jgi:hypothetical protein